MRSFRGEIKNEKDEVIFSRVGKFETEEKCLEALHNRVLVDIPDEYSLVNNMIFGSGDRNNGGCFKTSPFSLKRKYFDIKKLKFEITQL